MPQYVILSRVLKSFKNSRTALLDSLFNEPKILTQKLVRSPKPIKSKNIDQQNFILNQTRPYISQSKLSVMCWPKTNNKNLEEKTKNHMG